MKFMKKQRIMSFMSNPAGGVLHDLTPRIEARRWAAVELALHAKECGNCSLVIAGEQHPEYLCGEGIVIALRAVAS